jgi:Domain of unknown function (DUF5655)
MGGRAERPMWTCASCGRTFAARHQTHTCAPLGDLDAHFGNKEPRIRAIYDAFAAAVGELGEVEVLPEKTRIAFHARMSFAQLTPRKQWVDGHVVLARRLEHPRFRRIETFSPRNHVHHFRLSRPDDVDADVRAWLAEAHAVGLQLHLR